MRMVVNRRAAMRHVHELVVDLVAVMNVPHRDDVLLAEAGVTIDRALFPLLVGIDRYGPVGVGELADRAGRDHTTVSRQVARLADLGLIDRRPSPVDRRVHEAVLTGEGRQVIAALDAARQRLNTPVFSEWSEHDLLALERLLRRYVDDLHAMTVP
jgi:DNA-binding MarR family transcriptional regulator